MKIHITLASALAVAWLSTGCVVAPLAPPPPPGPEVAIAPEDIYVPGIVIVEGGVVHDRAFYRHHPDMYRHDREKYPARFRNAPPPRRDNHHKKQHDGHGPDHGPDDQH